MISAGDKAYGTKRVDLLFLEKQGAIDIAQSISFYI
jgi:hypothetical protein